MIFSMPGNYPQSFVDFGAVPAAWTLFRNIGIIYDIAVSFEKLAEISH